MQNLEKYAPLAKQAIDAALEEYNKDHAVEIAQAKYEAVKVKYAEEMKAIRQEREQACDALTVAYDKIRADYSAACDASMAKFNRK